MSEWAIEDSIYSFVFLFSILGLLVGLVLVGFIKTLIFMFIFMEVVYWGIPRRYWEGFFRPSEVIVVIAKILSIFIAFAIVGVLWVGLKILLLISSVLEILLEQAGLVFGGILDMVLMVILLSGLLYGWYQINSLKFRIDSAEGKSGRKG